MASPKRRVTKKQRKGKVLHVRSNAAVNLFEKLLSKGPLTLVFVKKETCGPCHRFDDEVWQPLTKLKNKSVNLATVDSEMLGNTSLSSAPPKFYPTLMLVGKDKKPATFEDEEGNPTNAMPRNNTLSEDREALSNLVMNPTVKPSMKASMSPMSPSMQSMQASMNRSMQASMSPSMSSSMSPSMTSSMNALARSNSPRRANVTKKSLARSPFEPLDTMEVTSDIPRTVSTMKINSSNKQMGNTSSRRILTSTPPDPASDLVASQSRSPTPTASVMPEPIKGGMLTAIRQRVASLKSVLNLRSSTRKHK